MFISSYMLDTFVLLMMHAQLTRAFINRSHHEKLVIVDYQICFLGGLDLCFGRYDTVEHRIGDCPSYVWPGKDYYNPRYFSSLRKS